MSPRTGRPMSENPKDKLLQVRMTQRDMEELDECAKAKACTRAEIVREGIQRVKASLDEEKS